MACASECVQYLTASNTCEVVGFAALRVGAQNSLQAEMEGVLMAQCLFIQAVVWLEWASSTEGWPANRWMSFWASDPFR